MCPGLSARLLHVWFTPFICSNGSKTPLSIIIVEMNAFQVFTLVCVIQCLRQPGINLMPGLGFESPDYLNIHIYKQNLMLL